MVAPFHRIGPRRNVEPTGVAVSSQRGQLTVGKIPVTPKVHQGHELRPGYLFEGTVEVAGVPDHHPVAHVVMNGGLPILSQKGNASMKLDDISLAYPFEGRL